MADTDVGPGGFPSTHWSVVLSANGHQTAAVTAALETLFRTYQKPLYWYIPRRGNTDHDAEDVLQAFFARLLAKEVLRVASQQRGRFRSFLLASLKNFLANEGKEAQFTALAPFLSRLPGPGEYGQVAERAGIRPGLMATVVARLRRRFHELVRAEIAATVASPAEVDEELRYLVDLMSG